ncbi:MAG: hypothetical protein KI793_26690 [Rivularia sp. (in: Bacteria)]|nr:hypothetical protein [Rivularia sp. MS3]
MNNEFKPVNDGEIISVNYQEIGCYLNLKSNGFDDVQIKSEQLAEVIKRKLNIEDRKGQTLFKEGISCEVFKSGATGLQNMLIKSQINIRILSLGARVYK